jgi:hypothetical protein
MDTQHNRRRQASGRSGKCNKRLVFVYRNGRTSECMTDNQIAGEGPVSGFMLDVAEVWQRYED